MEDSLKVLEEMRNNLNTDEFIENIVFNPSLRSLVLGGHFLLNDIERYKYKKFLQDYNDMLDEQIGDDDLFEIDDDDIIIEEDISLDELEEMVKTQTKEDEISEKTKKISRSISITNSDNDSLFYPTKSFMQGAIKFENTKNGSLINKEDLRNILDQLKQDFSESLDVDLIERLNKDIVFYIEYFCHKILFGSIVDCLESALLFYNSTHNIDLFDDLSDYLESPCVLNYHDRELPVKLISFTMLKGFCGSFLINAAKTDELPEVYNEYIEAASYVINDSIGEIDFKRDIIPYSKNMTSIRAFRQVFNENISNLLRSTQYYRFFEAFIEENNISSILSSIIVDDNLGTTIDNLDPENIIDEIQNHIQFGGHFILYDDVEDKHFIFKYDPDDISYKIVLKEKTPIVFSNMVKDFQSIYNDEEKK